MCLYPVKQGQLVLCKLLKDLGLLVTGAQLVSHFLNLCGDSLISGMLVEGLKQIQLGVLLDLNAEIVKLLDRCITCKEVQRSGTEGNDLQIGKSDDCSCDRNKLVNHVSTLFRSSYRILGDICLDIAQL